MSKKKLNLRAAIIACACGLFAAGQAQALSCIQPNFAEQFNRLHAAPEVYYVGYGHLTPREPEPAIGDTGDINRPLERFRRYSFTGGFLDGYQMTQTRTYRVDTTASCAGPWCGNFPVGTLTGLFFLRVDGGGGLSFEFGACPGGSLEQPTAQQISLIQGCIRGGGCAPGLSAAFSYSP